MISSSQCRAARGLLDWSQQQLANAANVGIVTVRHFEAGKVDPRPVRRCSRFALPMPGEFLDQKIAEDLDPFGPRSRGGGVSQ